jgi:hypothetical protein
MNKLLLGLALAFSFSGTVACGGSIYMPSRVANFDPDGAAEVNDEDVRKAFEAKPQLGEKFNVAYFSFDESKGTDVEKAVRDVPGVSSVYAIPALEATGKHRYDDSPTSAPLSMKKLRLLAARAHADVLVVVDYSRKTEISVNALAALNVFIVPALFLPFRDVKVESAVDAFVVDVRNGYVYGHVALSEEKSKSHQTIYSDDDELARDEWKALRAELSGALVKLADVERATKVPGSHT